jgi:hypothetical protein
MHHNMAFTFFTWSYYGGKVDAYKWISYRKTYVDSSLVLDEVEKRNWVVCLLTKAFVTVYCDVM